MFHPQRTLNMGRFDCYRMRMMKHPVASRPCHAGRATQSDDSSVLLRVLLCCLLEVVPDGSAADGHFAEEFVGDGLDGFGMSFVAEHVFCFVEHAAHESFQVTLVGCPRRQQSFDV